MMAEGQMLEITDGWGVTETFKPTEKVEEYHGKAVEAMKLGRELATGETWEAKEGWKKEAQGKHGEIIYSKHVSKVGKVFVATNQFDIDAESYFKEVFFEVAHTPKWNPTIEEYTVLGELGSQSRITYSKSFDMIGGLVKARDFVEAGCWRKFDGWWAGASQAIEYKTKPPIKSAVRASNHCFFQVIPTGPGQCKTVWMQATDLKGYLPRSLTDRVMHSMMMDYMYHQRIYMQKIFPQEEVHDAKNNNEENVNDKN